MYRFDDALALLFVGSFVAVGAMIVRRVTAVRRDSVAPAHELSLDAADALVRATQIRAAIAGGLTLALVAGGWSVGIHTFMLFIVAIVFAVQSYMNAWRVQTLLVMARASAELRGTTLTACSDGAHASVIVSRAAAERARQQTMPRAIVR